VVIFSLILRFIYPLTGLGTENALYIFLSLLVLLNAMLMIFNLIPVPPLDGSKLLMAILPSSLDNVKIFLEKYGFFILILLIFLGQGLLVRLFSLIISTIQVIFKIQLPLF
jgi:Zn-dependent protease